MSYNPNVHGTNAARLQRDKRRRKLSPHAGRKRSDYAKQGFYGVDYGDIQNKKATNRGWKIEVFKGDDFEVVYELIAAQNATGKIKNEKADRCVRVLHGQLFVETNEEPFSLTGGQSYVFEKGEEYQFASSGVADVEVLFCQGPGYEEDVEQLSAPTLNPQATSEIPKGAPERRMVDPDKAKKQAAAIKSKKSKGEKARHPVTRKKAQVDNDGNPLSRGRAPLPGQNVSGASPQPIGAGGYNEG